MRVLVIFLCIVACHVFGAEMPSNSDQNGAEKPIKSDQSGGTEDAESNTAGEDDPKDRRKSFDAYMKLRNKLPLSLRTEVALTDEEHDALLAMYSAGVATFEVFSRYWNAFKWEITIFNFMILRHGPSAEPLIKTYLALRKGEWNFNKLKPKFKSFFDKRTVQRQEYEISRRTALERINIVVDQFRKMRSESGGEPKNGIYVKEMAETAEETGAREVGKAEVMKREVRARDAVEFEEVVGREDAENIVASADETREDIGSHGNHDNATYAGFMNSETTHSAKFSDSSNVFRIAIVFGAVTQVAILVAGIYWYKTNRSVHRNKEGGCPPCGGSGICAAMEKCPSPSDDLGANEDKKPKRQNNVMASTEVKKRNLVS